MKKEASKKVLKMLGRIAEYEGGKSERGWPPPCMGIIYQPKRPKSK